MGKKIVVVGASAASIAFITKLRSFDKDSQIVCISGEAEIPYNRCFLADYVSQEKSFEEIRLKPEDFFVLHKINLRLGTWVTKIDTASNAVFVGDEKIVYDYLFLGIGSRPFVPNIGVDFDGQEFGAKGLFTFYTADDVNRLTGYLEQHKPENIIVIGAGLNGIECASALQQRGFAVGLIERSRQLLPLQLDQQGADWLKQIIQHKGIGLILGHTVSQICTVNGVVKSVRLQSGALLPTGCVVLATGSVVNSMLLSGSGIVTQQGAIPVDACMRTNVENVFAGGDVCLVKDSVSGALVQSTTWADAMLQGLCAATQLSDTPRQYSGFVGLRDSTFFEYSFYACGKTIGHDDHVEVVYRINNLSFKAFYIEQGYLIGFVLLGDTSRVADYKRMYLTKVLVVKDDLM